LAAWCDSLIEACWLLALVVAALFFNVYSNRTFEPDKIVLVRSLALIAAVAWLIRLIEQGWGYRGLRRTLGDLRRPMVVPALLFAAVTLLATVTSVAPLLSIWGSYQRLQGTYTTLAGVALFLLATASLDAPGRRERLVTTVIWTSIPVALYGIVQQLGWDPVVWSTGFGERVASTLGNPIFAGGYLIMVVPLTLARAVEAWTTGRWKVLAGHALLIGAQVACTFLTLSRGPLLGLVAGFFTFAWLMAAVRRHRRWLVAMAAATLIVVTLALPLAGQVVNFLDLGRGTAQQRLFTWQGVMSMIAVDPLRSLLGYGPETMLVVFPRHFPPELAPLAQPGIAFDRAHNVILDELATMGIAGVAAYLLLVGGFFFYGLRRLNLVPDRRWGRAYWLALLAGIVAGAAITRLADGGWRFAGLGVSAGTLVAVLGYSGASAWVNRSGADTTSQLPVVASLAAGVAHFVELQTGIAVIATRLLFWLLIALVVTAPGRVAAPPPSLPKRSRAGRRLPASRGDGLDRSGLVAGSLLLGAILATVAFDLLNPQVDLGTAALALVPILGGTWALGLGIWDLGFRNEQSANRDPQSAIVYACVSGTWLLAFLVPHLFLTTAVGDGTAVFYLYVVYLAATAGLMSLVLVRSLRSELPFASSRAWIHPALAALTLSLIFFTNLNVTRADMDVKLGLAYANAGQFDQAIQLFEGARRLAPYQDSYAIYLAGAYAEKGRSLGAPAAESWFQRGQEALGWGQRLNPLNPDHPAKLGLLHRVWAEVVSEPEARRAHLERAAAHYAEAMALSPQSAPVHSELGLVYQALGDLDAAISQYELSATLSPRTLQTHLLLADAFMARGDLGSAAEAFRRAVALDRQGTLKLAQDAVTQRPDDFIPHRDLAVLYWVLGEREQALAEAQTALQMAQAGDRADLERLIAALEASSQP